MLEKQVVDANEKVKIVEATKKQEIETNAAEATTKIKELEVARQQERDAHLKEKCLLEKQVSEGGLAIREMEIINQQRKEEKDRKVVRKAKGLKVMSWLSYTLFFLFCVSATVFFIITLKSDTDSNLTLFATIFAVVVALISAFGFKKMNSRINAKFNERVKKHK